VSDEVMAGRMDRIPHRIYKKLPAFWYRPASGGRCGRRRRISRR
jgi:hypothetical protein